MAIYYKDFNGKIRTVVAGKAPFPVADNLTLGGVKVTGGPGESAPYKVMSEGAVDSKLFDYAKKDHTHLMKEVYKLDESLDSKAPIDHIHDDRYYTESEVDWAVNQISERIGQVDDKLAGKADTDHTHSDYLTKTEAGDVYQPKSAMALYATKEDLKKVGSTGYLYMLAAMDTTASRACLDSLRKYERIEDIAKDGQAMEALTYSPTAMPAVVNSPTAMQAVAESITAMQAVAESITAIRATVESPIALKGVAASPIAMGAITDSKYAKVLKVISGASYDGRFIILGDDKNSSVASTVPKMPIPLDDNVKSTYQSKYGKMFNFLEVLGPTVYTHIEIYRGCRSSVLCVLDLNELDA